MATVLLIDNGSMRAGATLLLRRVAEQLSSNSGMQIDPVSLQHANRIDSRDLDGMPANIFYDYLRAHLQVGERQFIALPLFFGLSRALTSFVPDKLAELNVEYGQFDFHLAETIYPLQHPEERLVQILRDNIFLTAEDHNLSMDHVVLVDHGSPVQRVTAVRESIAERLALQLGDSADLSQAVMERRPGIEYDFNGPLLEDWLMQLAGSGAGHAIVAMMFFLPGRHAGAGGDVELICERVMQVNPGFTVVISPLIGEHSKLTDILHDRLKTIAETLVT